MTFQPDTLMKDFWRKTANFNDICNGIMFTGETVIQDAVELDSEQGTTTENGSIQRRRDLIKKVNIDGKDVIIGIENQQESDKTMPFRDMEYTSLKYHIRLKDSINEVLPIITLVLYYGCKKWNSQTELEKMMDIPDKVKQYFNNWKTIVIDAKDVNYEVFQTKEVRDFFEGLQNLYNWDKDIRHLKDLTLTYDTALALGVVTGTEPLIKATEKMKGGMIHMCQAVDEALQEREMQGRNIGFQEGEARGRNIGLQEGKRNIVKQQLTKKLGSLSNTVIERLENSTAENIDRLIIAIFDIENEDDILQLIN